MAPTRQHCVLLILDSLRHDSLIAAKPQHLSRLGPLQRRYSYASWTSPAHYNLLQGLLPHSSPRHTHAVAHYQREYQRWGQRLGLEDLGMSGLLPHLWLPHLLRAEGWRTEARVSMPALHPSSPLAAGFDHYAMMERHNDLGAIIDQLQFPEAQPIFHLINTGETHYPYATAEEDPAEWPALPGLRGALRQLSQGRVWSEREEPQLFNPSMMEGLRRRQVRAAAEVDRLVGHLMERCPPGTSLVVTADHGELFGEGGYFGHGPILHEKVLEVPYVEGKL
jgi:arylsulfatase A-like enzyme